MPNFNINGVQDPLRKAGGAQNEHGDPIQTPAEEVMPAGMQRESRTDRRKRHARDIETSQGQLRESIERTKQLLEISEEMLKRHRGECDANDD